MTTLTVTIDKTSNAKDIMQYLKSLDCVKNVRVVNKTINSNINFAIAGTPATDIELESLLSSMVQDSDKGINSLQLKSNLNKWKKKFV